MEYLLFPMVYEMNSKQLKSQHKEAYEQFFQKNEIVVSAPFLMTRAGDPSMYYSGITIKHKIPLRLYVGISLNKSGTIKMNDIVYFDKMNNSFIKTSILESAPHFYNLHDHIDNERKPLLTQYGGIDINILSELPRGIGLGFESIASLLISSALNRLLGTIDHTTIQSLNTLSIDQAKKSSDPKIRKRFTDAIVFDKLIFGRIISSAKRSSMFDSYYPVITIPKNKARTKDNSKNKEFCLDQSYTFRFDELFSDLKPIPFLPLDYGIIYSGKPMLLEQLIARNKKESIYLNGIKPELKKILLPYFEDLSDEEIPRFYKKFIDVQDDSNENVLYGNMLSLINIKILYFMSKLYSNEYNEGNVKSFIDALKKLKSCDYITKEGSSEFIEILKKLAENCKVGSRTLALFPNDTSIMGGTIGFAVPLEGYRKNIFNAVLETKKDFPCVDLIYCNWIDGIEHKGLIFEQDIQQGILSEFIDSQKYTLKNMDGINVLGDYNDLLDINEHDILLDCASNRLYIKGKKVTSSQIHSQTATIEVLQLLIKNIGKDVHSKQLSPSSYSKNKNEMLGKIVMPLLKLTKKELHKDFPLICKGMLYDFYMKLDKTDIKIGIIEKAHAFSG